MDLHVASARSLDQIRSASQLLHHRGDPAHYGGGGIAIGPVGSTYGKNALTMIAVRPAGDAPPRSASTCDNSFAPGYEIPLPVLRVRLNHRSSGRRQRSQSQSAQSLPDL